MFLLGGLAWTHLSQRTGGHSEGASPPNPPPQIHQRTVSSHDKPGLRPDLPEHVLSFTDIQGLVFRDHICKAERGRRDRVPPLQPPTPAPGTGSPQHSTALQG